HRDFGTPREDGVEVHLGELVTAVARRAARHDLQAVEEFGGLLTAVRLDQPDDDVGAAVEAPPRFAQHGERLADARSRAEVDPELSSAWLPGCVLGGHSLSVLLGRRLAPRG